MGKFWSKQPTKKEKRLALVGPSGTGKSAFVNAIRGFADDHEQAAKVNVNTLKPSEYIYPENPLLIFCDLPGYDAPKYRSNLNTYWNTFELEKFDGFLVFTRDNMTEFDLALAKKIKITKKSFFMIRTHIDSYCQNWIKEKGALQFNEKVELEKLKDEIKEYLSCNKEEIFFINNYDPGKWDFFRLIEDTGNMVPYSTGNALNEETRKYIKDNGVSGIEQFVSKKLEELKSVKIRIGITGDAGTGKSAFINAIRGLKDDDDGAAEVGVVETTKEPTEYEHPDNPMIRFVDLPGIGTPDCHDFETYCEDVSLKDYDTFLIFTASRFRKNDLDLAEKVKLIGKSFFLIRTKIDNDCRPKYKRPINEAAILEKIRQNCIEHVKKLISSEKEIFLISNYHKDKWDFDRLIAAISGALPRLQRQCFILSLSNVTRKCLKRKAKFFKAGAVAVAGASAASALNPIPGVGVVCDIGLIIGTIAIYYKEMGLNGLTSDDLGKFPKYIQDVICDRYRIKSVADLVASPASKMLLRSMGVEEASKVIPIVGSVVAASISFIFMLHFLHKCVNELEKAALFVWDDAAKRSIENSLNADTNNK